MMQLVPFVPILNENVCTSIHNIRVVNTTTIRDNVTGEIRASLSALGSADHISSDQDICLRVTDEYIEP